MRIAGSLHNSRAACISRSASVVGHLLHLLAREASHSQSASGSVGPVPIVSREAIIRSREGAFVMKVGVVGLGHMGSGMAASLLKAGHEVIVYNRTRAKAEPLIAQGARVVASVADACRESVVITMLANDNAVADLVLGKGGVIDSLPKGGIHISSSTISVALSSELAKAHAKAGQ